MKSVNLGKIGLLSANFNLKMETTLIEKWHPSQKEKSGNF